jgi:hypothetical protein
MKKKIYTILALLTIAVSGVWAQTAVTLTPTADNEWTFSLPKFNVEIEAVYYTDLLEASDNSTWLTDNDGETADIWLGRTLQAGAWNTFAAPFDISASELTTLGITAKELASSSYSNGKLTLLFSDATSIEAGKPYMVKVAADVATPTFDDVTISKTTTPTVTSVVDFVPSLGKTLATGPTGDESNNKAVLFLAANNKLYNPTVVNDSEQAASFIKGFRAYFQLKDETSSAREFVLDFGNGETTALKLVNSDERIENSKLYDLQGRKLSNIGSQLSPGVYIKNGRKIVIK